MWLRLAFLFLFLGFFPTSHGRCSVPPADAPGQIEHFEREDYCHHILAVDADGNALLPKVTRTTAPDGSTHYEAETTLLAGEDTRGAKLDPDGVQRWFADPSALHRSAGDRAIENVLAGRKTLCLYLDAMFRAIEREQPDEIVVHVHGGLNKINGAIEKTVLISDDLAAHQPPDHRIFYIGICWNSDLYPTYADHLFSIREGLRQPGKAIVTAPAMLLSDLGSAASRLPLNLINFLYQDAYTARPSNFKRTQLALTRIEQIRRREEKKGTANSLVVSNADNLRPTVLRKADAAQWLLSQPGKVATTFFLDWLGSEPWKNMLRRTRTMFERESEFIPSIDYVAAGTLAKALSKSTRKPVAADTLLDQLNATGRQGAVSILCEQAQSRLTGLGKRPRITLIGHSMGAIVACEIMGRFHRLPLDNAVFMGAACSINDFKNKVVPYLQEQNLRESLRAGMADELKRNLILSLKERGVGPEAIDVVRQEGDRLKTATPNPKTRFYNLCLHDTAENGEKNPAETDLVQRGSLLTWIDVLYQKPESENDRTFGRWINAILATDSLPGDIVDRVTIKEFGVDRPLKEFPGLENYAYRRGGQPRVQEPEHHGDFSRFVAGTQKNETNIAFWRELYRASETPFVPAPLPTLITAKNEDRRRGASRTKGGSKTAPQVLPPAIAPSNEPAAAREARTGF